MQTKQPKQIGVLIGSLRTGSISRSIAKALIGRAPEEFACTIIEIGDLPLYNEDLDKQPPAAWTRFREEIRGCDALLFVTPEYNRSIPGCLKNATDIGSRPEGENLFDALPAAIVSVTPYSLGAFGANHALRQSCVYLNLRVMQQPEAYIGKADTLVARDGEVTDKKTDEKLRTFMTEFASWIELTAAPGGESFASFMKDREAASNAYINGDDQPLQALAVKSDPASFFPPNGACVAGATAVSKAHHEGAKAFRTGSTGSFDTVQSGSSGTLAFWTGIQHADAVLQGKDKPASMALRTTEIYRFEGGGWKLAHRHADMMGNRE